MWSHPFIKTDTNGRKVAVVLIDTQGTFDNETTMSENATIFALSSVVSSVTIYNVSSRIGEDILQVNACPAVLADPFE